MNCSYRILKDVHIGLRVRKTKDKTTVPFNNEPMTGVKILMWNDQGFQLSHPDLPKDIWVDFYQLPLDKIQLEYGVIKNPITFVEEIRKGGSMVLVRADTLDYAEMLHDKKDKDEAKKYTLKELVTGDRVISCLCKQGNVMVYLGTFSIATMKSQRNYNYGYYNNGNSYTYSTIDTTPERAFFAYELPNGKYQINAYPITNKTILEMYRCDDKGSHRTNEEFIDTEKNLEIIVNKTYSSRYSYHAEFIDESEKKKYPNIEMSLSYKDFPSYVQIGKDNVRKNAFEFLKNAEHLTGYDKSRLYETHKEFRDAYSSRR
jgi:hypothetical protein